MATTVARLEALLTANTRGFDRAMDRSQGKMQKTGKAAGYMGAAIFAGLGVVAKRGFDELRSQQAVATQTAAVLRSTGGIAHVSSKQINEMANSLSKKTGIDDEAIQSGENLLLTFRGIRNETGKGNDMFNQATKAALDLSVAFHKDLNQSSILVGKALNDPIKGLTSLQRIGIQFTASQREQIKALVETGHTMEAQKIIMAELRAETGGSAEAWGKTLAGQLAKAKNAFDDVAAVLVQMVLPAFLKFAQAARSASEFLSAHPRLAKAVTIALTALATALLAARAAQLLMNLAVLANPYVAAAVAIGTLVAALVILQAKYGVVTRAVQFLRQHEYALLAVPIVGEFTAIIIVVDKLGGAFQRVAHWVGTAVNAVKELVSWLGKIHIPHFSLPHIGSPIGDGGGGGPFGGAGAAEGRAFNVGRQLWDEIAMGENVGLRVTSGYRAGAITKHGTLSDHGHNPSRAVDMAGPARSMARFFTSLVGRREIKQAFYDPLGSIFNGAWSGYREGGHSDHVHVAEYDKGGWLPTGLSLAMNNTGRPERVIAPGEGQIIHNHNYNGPVVQDEKFLSYLRSLDARFTRRNGRMAFGG